MNHHLLGTAASPTTGPDPARLPDGSPRPIDPATGLPLMTEREANWHAHFSAMGARTQAEARGSDPAATAAVSSDNRIAAGNGN